MLVDKRLKVYLRKTTSNTNLHHMVNIWGQQLALFKNNLSNVWTDFLTYIFRSGHESQRLQNLLGFSFLEDAKKCKADLENDTVFTNFNHEHWHITHT